MSNTSPTLEQFLAKAKELLQTTEKDLEELGQTALLKSKQLLAAPENDREPDERLVPWLQQIGRQLTELSDRSKMLRSYLQNDADTLPVDDDYWPRIRILQSQEEERMQLARALEDSIGQLLANTVFELASYQQLLDKTDSAPEDEGTLSGGLESLQAELEQGLSDFRYLITELDPSTVLSNFGLAEGIRRYLEQYEVKTGLNTGLQINTNFGRLPTIIETAIFRIIQETLSNVHRHANATQVDISIEEQDSVLHFSITDNGDGLMSEKIGMSRKNLGLARMIDYAELLNGKLRVLSEPQHGTQVILSIPYPTL